MNIKYNHVKCNHVQCNHVQITSISNECYQPVCMCKSGCKHAHIYTPDSRCVGDCRAIFRIHTLHHVCMCSMTFINVTYFIFFLSSCIFALITYHPHDRLSTGVCHNITVSTQPIAIVYCVCAYTHYIIL